MFWRVGLGMSVGGICLLVWGFFELRLGHGASSTPERITLKQLIARGPEGNPNIILTDFELCDRDYVYEEENGRWKDVYVPVVPLGEGPRSGGPDHPVNGVKAILFSLNVHHQGEIATVLGKQELPALVTNSITSLGAQQTRLLQQTYSGLDPKKVLIIQEGRKVMSGAILALIFGGGGVLLLGGVGVIARGVRRNRSDFTLHRSRRPRDEDEDKEQRPRKRRGRDAEEEDDRPRRRRLRDEDEDDEPRPKRRRPRDEDDE